MATYTCAIGIVLSVMLLCVGTVCAMDPEDASDVEGHAASALGTAAKQGGADTAEEEGSDFERVLIHKSLRYGTSTTVQMGFLGTVDKSFFTQMGALTEEEKRERILNTVRLVALFYLSLSDQTIASLEDSGKNREADCHLGVVCTANGLNFQEISTPAVAAQVVAAIREACKKKGEILITDSATGALYNMDGDCDV